MTPNASGTDEVDPAPAPSESRGGWIFPVLLGIVILAALWVGPQGPANHEQSAGEAVPTGWSVPPQGESLALAVDFGNGVQKQFAALPYRDAMTVEQLMHEAAKFRPGLVFSQVGEGQTGFLTAIDGVENRGANDRNWRYRVNGQHAETGFCLYVLQPQDRVLWEFALDE